MSEESDKIWYAATLEAQREKEQRRARARLKRKPYIKQAAARGLLEACKSVRLVVNADPDLHYLRTEPWFAMLDKTITEAEAKP